MLETLSPRRAGASVLREVSGLPGAESPPPWAHESAVRQVGAPGAHLQARRPLSEADRSTQREVTERFLAGCSGGDVEALLAALAPDAVLVSDGGGKASTALRPITGAEKVARFAIGIAAHGPELPGLRVEIAN